MRAMRFLAALLFSVFIGVSVPAQWWKVETSRLDTNLRGVTVVRPEHAKGISAVVVWASGSNGVILKSIDEGKTWQRLHVAGGEALDFRGVVAFNASAAYVMSSGEGEKSRIYKTIDGGETWNLQYTDKRKEFFLDTIACLTETHCFALGDPMDGRFLLLSTTDGEFWGPLLTPSMPAALPAEGAFAASNTCLLVSGKEIFFGTGGPAARVFHSSDSGHTWTVVETPIAHGNASSGIFSIARTKQNEIVVVGGNYQDPEQAVAVAAYSRDGGKSWQLSAQQPSGYRSSVACNGDAQCVAVGPNGEDVSNGKLAAAIWKRADALDLNAVAMLDSRHGWAVGPKGAIVRYIDHRSLHRTTQRDLAHPASPLPDK